jgi:RimJ/RimL family protein N-acetyltransferase
MLPQLSSLRLIFREFCIEDGLELQDYERLPEYTRLQAVEPTEYSDGTARVERYLEHRGSGVTRRLFVFTGRCCITGEVVGQFGLTRSHNNSASLGFGVAPKFWGKGYGTEIARCALTYGFDTLNLRQIDANVAIEHLFCCRVLEAAGMTQQGIFIDSIWAQGRWWTEFRYVIRSPGKLAT